MIPGSLSTIDDAADDKKKLCSGESDGEHNKDKVISGVVGAASSVTSIQVANLLRLFKIPQVGLLLKYVSFFYPKTLIFGYLSAS